MDVNILETLDERELIIIESRLKNSIIDLNKLILELYNENCRISQHNLELNNLKNKSPNTKERIGSLLKSAFFSQFNSSEKAESIILSCSSQINREYTSKCESNNERLFKCEETKNCTIKKPNINGSLKSSKDLTYNHQFSCIRKTPVSICHINSNQYDLKLKPIRRKSRGQTVSIEHGDTLNYTISLLVDGNICVEIKFSKFENDKNRENFAKEIIENIGLKPIYLDCIKNLLKDIEIGNESIGTIIDIANLDPWDNYNDISILS